MLGVTRITKESVFAPLHKVLGYAPMRRVANRTPLHFYGGMFMDEWTALIDVTGSACFIKASPLHQRIRSRTMSVVAVRALHKALENPVADRQGKLGLN
jgi:hypothetical protein